MIDFSWEILSCSILAKQVLEDFLTTFILLSKLKINYCKPTYTCNKYYLQVELSSIEWNEQKFKKWQRYINTLLQMVRYKLQN